MVVYIDKRWKMIYLVIQTELLAKFKLHVR